MGNCDALRHILIEAHQTLCIRPCSLEPRLLLDDLSIISNCEYPTCCRCRTRRCFSCHLPWYSRVNTSDVSCLCFSCLCQSFCVDRDRNQQQPAEIGFRKSASASYSRRKGWRNPRSTSRKWRDRTTRQRNQPSVLFIVRRCGAHPPLTCPPFSQRRHGYPSLPLPWRKVFLLVSGPLIHESIVS